MPISCVFLPNIFQHYRIGLRIYGAGTGFQSYYPEEHFLTEEYQQECTRDIG